MCNFRSFNYYEQLNVEALTEKIEYFGQIKVIVFTMSVLNLLIVHTLAVLTVTSTETVHNNNVPPHRVFELNDNFTTYKLTVPGSDPITIIESIKQKPQEQTNDYINHEGYLSDSERETMASHSHESVSSIAAINSTSPLPAKVIQRRNGERFSEKELVSRSSSLQPQKQSQQMNNRKQDVRTAAFGLQISDAEISTSSEKSKVVDDDETMVDGDTGGSDRAGAKKVFYSQEVLQKFIQHYSNKMDHADQKTKNALKEIERLNQQKPTNDQERSTDRIDFDDHLEQKYWDDQQYSGSQNSNQHHRPNQNPFNDKKGWVTLDAVPWSTSKVSKWHPNVDKYSNNYDDDIGQGGLPYAPSWNDHHHHEYASSSKPRPTYFDDNHDDDYLDAARPSPFPSSSSRPAVYTTYNPYRPATERPSYQKPPKYHYDQHHSSYDPPPRPPNNFNPRPRPTQYDYSSTGASSHNGYFVTQAENDNWYDNHGGGQSGSKPWSEDIITDSRPSSFPKPASNGYRRPQQRPSQHQAQDRYEYHPSHPESGNGEWVLVSTTKGYQPPARHGQRAMSVNHLVPQANDIVQHHSVKLTVLPTLNNTFSHDGRRPMVLSHGGLLEVESSFDTIDDSVASAFSSSKLNKTSQKTGNTQKRRIFKGVPVKSRITGGQDASAVLAAVGAGMVPATMAMLMPMVLGRKKRNANETTKISSFDVHFVREKN